jgi:hypothetical protein
MFQGHADGDRHATFEFVVMPLTLGGITSIEPPFWFGSTPLVRRRLIEAQLLWPEGAKTCVTADPASKPAGRFQVLDGGIRGKN